MAVLFLILLVLAAACFAGAAITSNRGGGPNVNLVAVGLLCWVLVPLIQAVQALAD